MNKNTGNLKVRELNAEECKAFEKKMACDMLPRGIWKVEKRNPF